MAEILLFHHAQGLTGGCLAFAEELRGAGHVVHAPDLFEGQQLAQTRAGARGAVLMHSCVPPSEFGGPWPDGVPLQIHLMEDDEFVLPPESDLEAARELAATVGSAELFLYPGDRHRFTDSGLRDHDAEAAALLLSGVLAFLDGLA